jgi:hypothetical protein
MKVSEKSFKQQKSRLLDGIYRGLMKRKRRNKRLLLR